jgi:hypothetical protein
MVTDMAAPCVSSHPGMLQPLARRHDQTDWRSLRGRALFTALGLSTVLALE